MNIEATNSRELLQSITNKNLYDNLVVQLKKDFNRVNIEIQLSATDNFPQPDVLVGLLREKIYHLLMERFTEYLSLLYIIDVPEKLFKNLKVTDAVEVADQVAFLILKREWQKVWYRNEYSG